MSIPPKNYADADFFLALIKDDDWLAPQVKKLYRTLHENITISPFTVAELMLVLYREKIPVKPALMHMSRIATLDTMEWDMFFEAGDLIARGTTPFDALMMVWAGSDTIISSDNVYKKFGHSVIDLKPKK